MLYPQFYLRNAIGRVIANPLNSQRHGPMTNRKSAHRPSSGAPRRGKRESGRIGGDHVAADVEIQLSVDSGTPQRRSHDLDVDWSALRH